MLNRFPVPVRRAAVAMGLVGLSLLVGACQGQMRDQINFRPQESPLPVPADQVPMNDQEVNTNYALGETGGPANPTAGNVAATLALGKEKFEAQCAPCHGMQGKGDGPVGKALIVPPADLTSARFKTMSDGQIYLRIVKGGAANGALMPSYAKKLTVAERWAVVNYVKSDIAGK
ncbi:MAG: c-type cytochrome [Cyanobacteria bacterium REEB65]|nr:c-type cytochrome [Cyanobacteria bacterium REEB65]